MAARWKSSSGLEPTGELKAHAASDVKARSGTRIVSSSRLFADPDLTWAS